MKRAIRIDMLVETTLSGTDLRELLGAFAQDLTKDCCGRIACSAVEVPSEEASAVWAKLNLGEKPKPGAPLWKPKRQKLS